MTNFKCAVSADLFFRANLGRSDEATRYYLNGVYVMPHKDGGAMMIGTNGHWLIAVRDPRGIVEGSAIVSLNKRMVTDLKAGSKDHRGGFGYKTERVLVVGADAAMIVLSGKAHKTLNDEFVEPRPATLELLEKPDRNVVSAQFADFIIDGTYPDWTRVIPTDADATRPLPNVDQRYVALAVKALTENKKGAVRFLPGPTEADPITVVASDKVQGNWEAAAVIMPMRGSSKVEVPSFWSASKESTK